MKKIVIVNGPNINLTGTREVGIYGSDTYQDIMTKAYEYGRSLGFEVESFQSNIEGAIIDKLHSLIGKTDYIILNAGAYTHYSYAIYDAIKAINIPLVEVHMSNIHAREGFRSTSVTGAAAMGVVAGFGGDSYLVAIDAINKKENK